MLMHFLNMRKNGKVDMDEYPIMSNSFTIMSSHIHDPVYAMMLNRKKRLENPDVSSLPTLTHSDSDIKTLEEFCMEHGIVGFNCGNMNPKAALEILKRKMGIVDHQKIQSKKSNLLFG